MTSPLPNTPFPPDLRGALETLRARVSGLESVTSATSDFAEKNGIVVGHAQCRAQVDALIAEMLR